MTDFTLRQPTVGRYVALPRRLAFGVFSTAIFFFTLFVVTVLRESGSDRYTNTFVTMAFLIAVPAVFFLVTWAWAIGDAITYDTGTWEACAQLRFLWIGLILLVWPVGAVVWLATIRPRLVQAEQNQ